MEEETRQVLLGMARILDKQEKQLIRLRHSVDRLIHHYADGDEQILLAVHESEDQALLGSLNGEGRQQAQAIIGIL